MKSVAAIAALSFVLVTWSAPDALALTQFRKAFAEKYADNHKSEEFKTVVKKATCNVCHVKGISSRKVHNDYGIALRDLIEGNVTERRKKAKAAGGLAADKAELDKILAELEVAFKKVEQMKSPTGETFGQLLKEGKLPVDLTLAQELHKKRKAEEEKKAAAGLAGK